MEIFIVGGGVLGKLIVDIAESRTDLEVGGFFDDGFPNVTDILGYPVCGTLADVEASKSKNLVIGVGESSFRKQFFEEKRRMGFEFPVVAHRSVIFSNHCSVGIGTVIGPNSTVLSGSTIGEGVCILSHVNVNQDVTIGSFCLIGAGSVLGNSVDLGEGCHIGLGKTVPLGGAVAPWKSFE